MARKKRSLTKATIFITMIIALNFVGISYGQWQEDLASEIRTRTGYIEPYFETLPIIDYYGGFSSLKAELDEDSKTIDITGGIKSHGDGVFRLDYTVFNNGSLPIEFDRESFNDLIQQIDGLTILEEPEGNIIGPGNSSSESITVKIAAPEIVIPEENEPQENELQENSSEEGEPELIELIEEYEFEIVLPYRLRVD